MGLDAWGKRLIMLSGQHGDRSWTLGQYGHLNSASVNVMAGRIRILDPLLRRYLVNAN